MFNVYKTNLKTIRSSDPDFVLKDGTILANRAWLEVSQHCPPKYKKILQECIGYGWIKPVATVYEWELTYSRLKND